MRSDCFTEIHILGKVDCIHRRHIQIDEPLSLLFGDAKVSVYIDQMGESELPSESVWTTERFSGERSQVINMLGPARSEEWLEQRVFEHGAVERLLKAMQHLFATCKFVKVTASPNRMAVIVRIQQQVSRMCR